MFHGAGHSREDINDFKQVVESLAPGAVVLFDDIRWNVPKVARNLHTYEVGRRSSLILAFDERLRSMGPLACS